MLQYRRVFKEAFADLVEDQNRRILEARKLTPSDFPLPDKAAASYGSRDDLVRDITASNNRRFSRFNVPKNKAKRT